MNAYIARVIDYVKTNYPNEPEFIQSVEEVLPSVEPVLARHPEYEKADLLTRMVEAERTIIFRVTWMGDDGTWHTNVGYRAQFNGALGPYKGGLRFQKNVNLDMVKSLAFEQTFKNALTGLLIGSGKGGSNFDPTGKSDGEIRRFCQSFMTALYRFIGPDIDVPSTDVGVGTREIDYLFGQYRRLQGAWENGVLTGKDFATGGSVVRPQATGNGALYFLEKILAHQGDTLAGKTIACSGFGNAAWGVCQKAAELGARVVTLSGPDGYVYDPAGVTTQEKLDFLVAMRNGSRDQVRDYADQFGVEFHPGEKPWGVPADICMPAAVQNDVDLEQARRIAANGVKYYLEVANMPTTNEALAFLRAQPGLIVAPGKAVSAGGVAASALEMAQNSERLAWSEEEMDRHLRSIMDRVYQMSVDAAEAYGLGYDLVAGANLAAFQRVADAMMAQGIF